MGNEIENLQELLQKDPSNFQARRELSILLAQEGFNEEALSNLKYLSKYFPEDAEIWYNLGIQYEKVKDFRRAKKAYEKAIEIYETLIRNAVMPVHTTCVITDLILC